MKADIVREEYECGRYCSPNGCMGHDGRVIGISLNGHAFCDQDSYTGDLPLDPVGVEAAVAKAVLILRQHNPEELAELQKDKKRLDWLSQQRSHIHDELDGVLPNMVRAYIDARMEQGGRNGR